MADPPSDAIDGLDSLASRLRNGDAGAADDLVRLHRDAMLRFCAGYLGTREEAEDAVQELFFKVLKAYQAPDDLRVWLYTIARNHCLNVIRARGRRKDGQRLATEFDLAASVSGHLTKLVGDEERAEIARAMDELPEIEREALRLRYVEDLSREAVAQVLGIGVAEVKSRLFSGLQRLRARLARPDDPSA